MSQVEPDSTGSSSPDDAREKATASSAFFRANVPSLGAGAPGAAISPSLPLPERIGHYRIIRVIGAGGMGMVLEAEQDKPRRIVALKIILPGVAKPEMLRRFADESEMLGLLQHPGIAQVYEAGTFDVGGGAQPYFAMEFVRGQPLTTFARQHNLGTRERLRLMIRICEAVQHAHQKGVIHRDLKPSNILVVDEDHPGAGTGERTQEAGAKRSDGPGPSARKNTAQPKILDFGVARLTASDIHSTTLRSDIGQLIGTIPYMSPEQTEGDPRNLDTRSDVYALGVICYELLVDRLPYDLQQKMIHEAVRVIREDDPTPLSSVNRVFRGDVETIVAKALEKDRDRRYQSATEFAADIERYLRDEPIVARPTTQWYRVKKFARRNKALVGGVMATFIALAGGLIGTATYAAREAEQKLIAEANEKKAEAASKAEKQRANELKQVADFQSSMLTDIDLQLMGVRLREDLLAEARNSAMAAHLDETETNQRITQFETLTAGLNFTNPAISSLDRNVLQRAVKAIDQRFANQPIVQASLLQTLAEVFDGLGLYQVARDTLQKALDLRMNLLGQDDRATARSIIWMGRILEHLGKLDEADPFYRQALEIGQRIAADEYDQSLVPMTQLGRLLVAQGKFAEAEPYLREALEKSRSQLGEDHPTTRSAIVSMAEMLTHQGKYAEAEQYVRKSLEQNRRLFGEEHADTIKSIRDMGNFLAVQGKLIEAEPYVREAYEKIRRIFGDEHQMTLTSQYGLGRLLKDQGKLTEAEPLLRDALDTSKRMLGADHPDTLKAMDSLAMLLQTQGKTAEAEALFRERLDRSRRLFGEENNSTIAAMNNLGNVLNSRGKMDEAEELWRLALEKSRRILGDDHPSTLAGLNNMSVLLQKQGKLVEAEPYCREALDKLRQSLGNDHPSTLIAINNLGTLLLHQGKLTEAEGFFKEGLDRHRRKLGDDHPNTLLAIANLGAVLKTQGKFSEAEPYLDEAVDRSRRKLGTDHLDTLTAIYDLGNVLEAQGKYQQAQSMFLEGLDISRRIRGKTHPTTMFLVMKVARVFYEEQDFANAESYFREAISLMEPEPQLSVTVEIARLQLGRTLAELARFNEAESLLIQAHHVLASHTSEARRRESFEAIGDLYEKWNVAEPGKGYDLKAAEWQAKLAALQAVTQPGAAASQPASAPMTDSASQPSAHAASSPATQSATQP